MAEKHAQGIDFTDARGPEGMRLYAIGDVHGRLDLLQTMHEKILQEIERDKPVDWRVIHLGDYVDRGPRSRQVIEFLISACAKDSRYIALAGNHDLGLAEFLANPSFDSLFVQFGGIQTAESYGVVSAWRTADDLHRFHFDLVRAVPIGHVQFILSRSFSVAFGDFFFCHAGIRPRIPLEHQVPEDLTWIRNPFLGYAGLHPKVVVHGHTVTREPELLANRVNVDTGAWQSGMLTALAVDGSYKRLVMVRE